MPAFNFSAPRARFQSLLRRGKVAVSTSPRLPLCHNQPRRRNACRGFKLGHANSGRGNDDLRAPGLLGTPLHHPARHASGCVAVPTWAAHAGGLKPSVKLFRPLHRSPWTHAWNKSVVLDPAFLVGNHVVCYSPQVSETSGTRWSTAHF